MPAWNWFPVPFTVEQLFTARHLRVFSIANLEPGAVFAICDVRSRRVFGDYTFQVQLAHLLE
jgi:hypothetical protein